MQCGADVDAGLQRPGHSGKPCGEEFAEQRSGVDAGHEIARATRPLGRTGVIAMAWRVERQVHVLRDREGTGLPDPGGDERAAIHRHTKPRSSAPAADLLLGDGDERLLPLPPQQQERIAAGSDRLQRAAGVADALHRPTVHLENDVARPHAGTGRRHPSRPRLSPARRACPMAPAGGAPCRHRAAPA